jgi:hypothetical protein
MKKIIFMICSVLLVAPMYAAPPQPAWQGKLAAAMPLLGHRNWVLVVDSAYPLQTSPGVETIETNASQLEVVQAVLNQVNKSVHVRPVVFMDAELPFLTEQESPGVTAYRAKISSVLSPFGVQSELHEKLIANVDDAGKTFHILVLKTNMTIPYTSVFFRLDCKYWTAEQDKDLRERMSKAGK